MNRKVSQLTAVTAAFVMVLGLASAASAQVFTGRIDVTVEDSTGGRLPGVNVDITGPENQTQTTDAQGQAHFLNLPVGKYSLKANISGFNPYTNASVQVATASATPVSVKLAVAGTSEVVNVTAATPIIDTKKRDDDDERVARGAAEHPERARSVGRHADGPEHLRGSRQRRRLRIGPAVQLHRQGLARAPTTRGTSTASRSPTWARPVPSPMYYDFDMFQEMAVTTGGADAQNPTPRRAAEHGAQEGQQHAARRRQHLLREPEPAVEQHLPADLAASARRHQRKRQSHGQVPRRWIRSRRADPEGPRLGLGAHRTDRRRNSDADRRLRTKPILKNYALKADAQFNTAIRGNFTFYEGNKVKNGRSVGPLRPARDRMESDGPDQDCTRARATSSSARTCSRRRGPPTSAAGSSWRPQGGLDARLLPGRQRRVRTARTSCTETNRPQYYAGGDAQLLRREARGEIRLLVAQDAGRFVHPVAGAAASSPSWTPVATRICRRK